MIVMKFGGSSMADAERIKRMASIVKTQLGCVSCPDSKPVIVLSAMGDTTDNLIDAGLAALNCQTVTLDKIESPHLQTVADLGLTEAAAESVHALLAELRTLLTGISLIRELTNRTRDYLVSFGERLSVRIAAAYFTSIGINALALDAWDAGFISDSNFTRAELLPECWELIPEKLIAPSEKGVLQIVTGFIAKDEKGNITTLGRGGSDLSATMIAAACRAKEVQVWKDVDGILTADPRIAPNAKPVQNISYEVASELAHFGAQVLHPHAMQPCIKTNTPVLVKNSYNPDAGGTRIIATQEEQTISVQALTFRKNISLVDIVSSRMLGQYGFLAEVFSSFARYGLSVDMVATSEVSVSLTLDNSYDLSAVKKELERIAGVEIKTGKAIITIIGNVHRSSRILATAFTVCQTLGVQVEMISQGASKVNISFIVDESSAAKVIKALHAAFFEKA